MATDRPTRKRSCYILECSPLGSHTCLNSWSYIISMFRGVQGHSKLLVFIEIVSVFLAIYLMLLSCWWGWFSLQSNLKWKISISLCLEDIGRAILLGVEGTFVCMVHVGLPSCFKAHMFVNIEFGFMHVNGSNCTVKMALFYPQWLGIWM